MGIGTNLRLGATNRNLRSIDHKLTNWEEEDEKGGILLFLAFGAILWPIFVWLTFRNTWAGLASVAVASVLTGLFGWTAYVGLGLPVALVLAGVLGSRP